MHSHTSNIDPKQLIHTRQAINVVYLINIKCLLIFFTYIDQVQDESENTISY